MIEAHVTQYEATVTGLPCAGFTEAEADKPLTTIRVRHEPVYAITDARETK